MTETYQIVKEESYFRKVLGNMRSWGLDGCTVQFGETGKGISPHYMITDGNTIKHIYRGTNHDEFTNNAIEEFSEINLSSHLTVAQVQDEIRKRKSAK
jgi:hypothetical protein